MQKMRDLNLKLRSSKFRNGATAVEMAVVAPLFFLLIIGLVEFVRMGMVKQSLTDAARAGCRTAVLVGTSTDQVAETTVRNYLQSSISDSQDVTMCRVSISPSNLAGMASGVDITTKVEVNYSDVSWLVPSFLETTVLRGESTMKRE